MKLTWTLWPTLAGILLKSSLSGAIENSKPDWLTDCSVGIKESYDNNVFLSGVNNPPPYKVPAGSVAALKDCYSWITTISPKVGVNLSPLAGTTNVPVLGLVYSPDLAIYHNQTSESFNAQRVLATIKGNPEPVSFSGDNNFTYIDGSGMGPFYPGNQLSAFATVADKERRRQINDRANVSVQLNQDHWFVRPVASLLYYNMMTELLNTGVPANVGYQNYCDRYDVNGGADFGYKVAPQLALTLGYRYGHQYQQQYSFSPYSSSSDYQRLLAGIEGNPWTWLTVKIQGGPDFRNYQGDSATHTTPVDDLHPVTYYDEASLTANFAPDNTLTFKTKSWQWVSCLGKTPYFDSTYELAWHRQLAKKLGFDLGGKILDWDFTSGNLKTCRRNDLEYVASAGLGYAVNSHISVTLACSLNWGINAESDVSNPGARQFDQQVISLGTQWKF